MHKTWKRETPQVWYVRRYSESWKTSFHEALLKQISNQYNAPLWFLQDTEIIKHPTKNKTKSKAANILKFDMFEDPRRHSENLKTKL